MSDNVISVDEIRRNLQSVYEQCVRPWKARTLEDALQIFRKVFDSYSSAGAQLSSAIFNALADMVAAILDSGAIQHQRAELQKDLAIDFAEEALAIWSKSESSESTLVQKQDTAFLQYLAGTATVEQVCLDFV